MRWFGQAEDGKRTLVVDNTRPSGGQQMLPLQGSLQEGTLSAKEIQEHVKVVTAGVWQLWRVSLIVWVVLGYILWEWAKLEISFVLSAVGVLAFISYLLAWQYEREKFDMLESDRRNRYNKFTEALAEPPRPAPSTGVVVGDSYGGFTNDERLLIELRYVIIRAFQRGSASSPRGNDYEIIPHVNVRMDAKLYRFLMYVLRELGLVTGGRQPDGRNDKWIFKATTKDEALEAFNAAKHRLKSLNLRELGGLANYEPE